MAAVLGTSLIVGLSNSSSAATSRKLMKAKASVSVRGNSGTPRRHGKRLIAASRSVHLAKAKTLAGKRLSKAELAAESSRRAVETERTVRLNSAFVATAQLRPMAQQLAFNRSPAGFSGVTAYAQSHPGAGAATAYLSLGHAYMLDRRFGEAGDSFRQAANSEELSDYADYLGAQAMVEAGRITDAFPLLDKFADRHPESIFNTNAPLLLANAYNQQKNAAAAVRVLEPLANTPQAERSDFRYALGRSYQLAGDNTKAAALYRSVYVSQPLAFEASLSLTQLQAMGLAPSASERKVHADQMFNAKRYGEASIEYSAIRNDPSLMEADRNALQIYSAVCDLKLKHLGRKEAERLPVTGDDSAALKLYLLAEISRTEKDRTSHDALINQMVERYPKSRWLEEALYSGGNMYLLTHDMPQAIYHYHLLTERFPNSIYAPSAHWREAWMNYRMRHYAEAGLLMDEQIVRYGAGVEASSALYWRGRIYEDDEHNFPQAMNYYRALTTNYCNFYYGNLAKQRLTVLGNQPAVAPAVALSSVRKLQIPDLAGVVPEDDPHVIRAKLLANAALNEYIGPEIAASSGSSQWGALAQAQIYSSYGEYTRALQSMKHSGISFFSLPTTEVPTGYWKLMFPQPYWNDIVSDSQKEGLDPYFVASLIRQESEFNAGAVSPAHAFGLMQLLPSVGKENAKKEGMKGFQPVQLLNPTVNLKLGTRNLKQVLDRFGGQPEYALAAYNAGDVPVRQWMANGEYKDIAEFVESIPYTETREYVQAIMRNREMYRILYATK
jgi:soluble lytic murein transglycosylase